MTHESERLLLELKDGLAGLYGDTLRGVYLYGSYARGDFDAESDFDVLVVLDGFASYGAEVDRTAGLASELSLRHGLSISMVFVRECDWRAADTPFLRQVRDEAIAA
jgi:predicted nucleotidyltransferase